MNCFLESRIVFWKKGIPNQEGKNQNPSSFFRYKAVIIGLLDTTKNYKSFLYQPCLKKWLWRLRASDCNSVLDNFSCAEIYVFISKYEYVLNWRFLWSDYSASITETTMIVGGFFVITFERIIQCSKHNSRKHKWGTYEPRPEV